jgi:hypothetical protein
VRLAAWVLPAGMLTQTLILLLEIVSRWATNTFEWQWPVYLAGYAAYPMPFLRALVIVAFWLLTAPEVRPHPAPTRSWARWLTILASLMPLVFTFLPSLWPGVDYVAQRLVSAIGMICLLILMRNYSLRYHDIATARLLRVIAIFGGADAIAGLLAAVLVWIPGRPEWALFILAPLMFISMAFGLALYWALIRFALSFQHAVRSQRPQTRLAPVLWSTLAAIVLGGIAGAAAETVFLTQVKRAEVDWTDVLQQLYGILTPLSIILAAAVLPHALQRLFRVYTRHH